MDLNLLRRHVADGVVREQKHDNLPLSIFNYSERCQYERLWDDVTLQCRGLVMYGSQFVARPFRKFFNDTEHAPEELPWHLPCEVTEKLDGSLWLLFSFENRWIGATRGSFCSEQAERGMEIFQQRYRLLPFNPDVTYCFEVLYPQNRIVVDYGGREDIVLLGMFDTATGRELPLSHAPSGVPVVRTLPPDANAKELRSLIRDDEEGYVVRFENGFRVKVKGARYMELHRLITGISSRSIWETLAEGRPFDELLAVVPDEFGDWVRREREQQLAEFKRLQERVWLSNAATLGLPDRKAKALKIIADFKDVSGAAFAYLDGKAVDPILWKQLYPEFRRPQAAARIEA